MKEVNSLSEVDLENDQEFKYRYYIFKRDTKLRDQLNRMLSANLKHVFSREVIKEKDNIDFGCGSFICVNQKGKFTQISSSEYGDICYREI